ncbi:MAG TPA: BglII/BstYI family type II restriction endonuclease [Flavobacterium sp.]|uniref:BglII/BstYI family type II restriction endonuclease n=1 Tax=unclassified Flavobacterium TaxID=196869 RepID=UPI0025C26092|nr:MULTISPECIES: BglII/BstYI family type II restriction endonuclease [unclassified Flavobacterium]HRE76447.1 BglII/BstYI family type II restriction endonuclease [Flavobacterium sp.]
MKYRHYSFRHAGVIFHEPEFVEQFYEMIGIIENITEEDIIQRHNNFGALNIEHTPMSLSKSINNILKDRFVEAGWNEESAIFQDNQYQGETWRLDFAKDDISIEVAFNHSSVIAWNLLKPVLASELNHVNKAIQTKLGVVITATEALKRAGGFDGAVGTYEKYIEYLPPLNNVLTVPLLIIGLEPPETFHIEQFQHAPRKKIGKVVIKDLKTFLENDEGVQL